MGENYSMSNKILVTGGAGFIGSKLVKNLYNEGNSVVVLDNLNPQVHGADGNSFSYKSIIGFCEFIKGDVISEKDWATALVDVNTIIHLAAETGTGQSMYESMRYTAVNTMGTAILADYLVNKKHKIKKVIVASSRAVYGEGKYACVKHGYVYPDSRLPEKMNAGIFECLCPLCTRELEPTATDENSRISPLSVYALTKFYQENLLINASKVMNIPVCSFRFQNVYGPGQSLSNPYTGIISIFSTRMKGNKDIIIFEDGKESRDFVYVEDVITTLMLAVNTESFKHNIYNVGSGKMTTIMEVSSLLKDLLNSSSEIKVTGQYRKGDIRHNFADLTLLKNDFNFLPEMNIKTGLKKFVDWAEEQEIFEDQYDKSLHELKRRGLFK